MECNLVMVGVANSGKSTLMLQLKPREVDMVHLAPTIPVVFHAEKFQARALTMVAFDLGDQRGFGNPWEEFYRDCHALIFVVDSGDRFNMSLVRKQLDKMMANPLLAGRKLPMLFLANKMDQPGAVSCLQLSQILELHRISGKPWHVCATDALTGEGLHEGFDWLAHQLRSMFRKAPGEGSQLRRAFSLQ